MTDIFQLLEDPTKFQENRLSAHSDHVFYDSFTTMENDDRTLYHSLNGMWKFHWSKDVTSRPVTFYERDFDLSTFQEIPVPSHIELNGYDKIHYINTMYPWDGVASLRPPFIDHEYCPVGSYVTFFDLPENFQKKSVCISFAGVEQAFRLWLNGTYIGYAEDTFTSSDFDLTDYIQDTNNRLCVEVYKRCSASWIEDQDFFRFSGIFRDVTLYAKPAIHVEDLWVLPTVTYDFGNCTKEDASIGEKSLALAEDFKKQFTTTFSVRMKLSQEDASNIRLQLFAPNGDVILDDKPTFHSYLVDKVECSENDGSYLESPTYDLSQISLWDLGKPNLYQFILTIYDQDGTIIETIPQSIGFRHFAIHNKVMYLNGKRIHINGVNRHEWNPRKGRAITAEDMLADIAVFKKNHITAVRTSHYPNQSLWYQLCDEAGILVMDETNLESHGSWQKLGACEPSWNIPGSLPEWRDCVVDRAVSMFERDKNHPSILFWSCGNESYAGTCILAMADYFRQKDDSRLVHYESCVWNPAFSHITDVESHMYATPDAIKDYLENHCEKPYILCEYMHDMGNSLGGMESYIKLFDTYESYQGGFIWDYMDQAIYHMKNGKEVLGYGGDFGDRPTDYNFSGNGIVFADRTEKPAMQEVRYWYQSKEQRLLHDSQNQAVIKDTLPIMEKPTAKPLTIIQGDVNLGIKGENFHILFSYNEGGPVSLVYDNYEWLYRACKPTYWRALTENDSANGFAKTSGIWNLADQYSKMNQVTTDTSDPTKVIITYTFDTLVGTNTTVTYTVYSDGSIQVDSTLAGKSTLPNLPLFGMRFITPEPISTYKYLGYSGETYPDRYKGGTFGHHQETVSIPDYLVPQECGCHMYSHAMTLLGHDNHSLQFTALEKPFHFSVLPNTAQELEQATHKDELPSTGRTVVSILSHMRGVGGIDSWGSDVETEYHVSGKEDLKCSFLISRK